MQKDVVIYKQAAIDALERRKDKTAKGEIGSFYNTIIQHDIDVIVELPSAEPDLQECEKCIFKPFKQFQTERKKGRWIDLDDHVMCSCCGATHYGADKNYCPNCGADCRGEDA